MAADDRFDEGAGRSDSGRASVESGTASPSVTAESVGHTTKPAPSSERVAGEQLRELLREAGSDHYTGACLLSVDAVMRVIENNPDVVLRALGMEKVGVLDADGAFFEDVDEVAEGDRDLWAKKEPS